MEQHRINRADAVLPKIGEIVLIVGEQKNRGVWMKGKVLRYIRGRDHVVRGAVLLHKGHEIERPLQLLCPLEIRSFEAEEEQIRREEEVPDKGAEENIRPRRDAAKNSQLKTQLLLQED